MKLDVKNDDKTRTFVSAWVYLFAKYSTDFAKQLLR